MKKLNKRYSKSYTGRKIAPFGDALTFLLGTGKASYNVREVIVKKSNGSFREHLTQCKVEQAIWDEVHRKLFFLVEQAPICNGKLRGDFGYSATSLHAQDVLVEGEMRYLLPTYVSSCPKGIFSLLHQLRKKCESTLITRMVGRAHHNKSNP